ncbi:MAG: hypothetical protein JM58_04370 [Peptococcaceae bacterium BICA1-8]|nr:MAG: hypothetical protein JM58_04370 [Peptococcaceae bacterium BICA1-8]
MNYVLIKVATAVALGGIGAFVAKKIRLPSSFFLGPIITIGLVQIFIGEISGRPNWFRIFIQIAVGIVIGTNFSKFSLAILKSLLKPALLIGILMSGGGLFIGFLIHIYSGLDIVTSFMGSIPGGQGEMAILAESVNAQTEMVILFQLIRNQFTLIFLLPLAKFLIKFSERKKEEQIHGVQ